MSEPEIPRLRAKLAVGVVRHRHKLGLALKRLVIGPAKVGVGVVLFAGEEDENRLLTVCRVLQDVRSRTWNVGDSTGAGAPTTRFLAC